MSRPPVEQRSVIGGTDAAPGIADIQIAIGEVDGEAGRHVVCEACIDGPGEIRLGVVLAEGNAVSWNVDVFQTEHVDRSKADTAADIGRDAKPRAEIDIGVEQADPALDVSRPFVGAAPTKCQSLGYSPGDEQGLAAIFAGDVEAEIVAGVVAEADAVQRRALDVLVMHDEVSLNSYSSAQMSPTMGLAAPINPLKYQGPLQPTQGSGSGVA